MGCSCARLPLVKSIQSFNPSLTEGEKAELEIFLSEIPEHCREIIDNLPTRQLFRVYRYHRMALNDGLKRNWSLAIFSEHRALRRLQILLPRQKDHFLFFYLYHVLSASYLALGELESAIESIQIALAILLKHTPMNYRAISKYYYYLAIAFKGIRDWRTTVKYLIKAIEVAELITDLDAEYIPKLENELQSAQEHVIKNMIHNFAKCDVKRKLGESDHAFHRRRKAETVTFNIQLETIIFNKQIEIPTTNEIIEVN